MSTICQHEILSERSSALNNVEQDCNDSNNQQQMNQTAVERKTKFSVVILEVPRKIAETYIKFFKANRIPYVDCSALSELGDDFRLSDKHPNHLMSLKIAECISGDIGR